MQGAEANVGLPTKLPFSAPLLGERRTLLAPRLDPVQ